MQVVDLAVGKSGSIQGAAIRVCANSASISGAVGASQFGCVAGQGIAPGVMQSGVTSSASSGGGHGGAGGAGVADSGAVIPGGAAYSGDLHVAYMGSGGGDPSLGGNGGGVVVMNITSQLQLDGVRWGGPCVLLLALTHNLLPPGC